MIWSKQCRRSWKRAIVNVSTLARDRFRLHFVHRSFRRACLSIPYSFFRAPSKPTQRVSIGAFCQLHFSPILLHARKWMEKYARLSNTHNIIMIKVESITKQVHTNRRAPCALAIITKNIPIVYIFSGILVAIGDFFVASCRGRCRFVLSSSLLLLYDSNVHEK